MHCTCNLSEATHAAAAPEVLKFPSVAVVDDVAVCLQTNTVPDFVVTSVQLHIQPVVAVPKATTPLLADPPVPTLTVKANGLTPLTTLGEVPNPELMLGTVGNA